ncbi:MAG TPA: bifunctional hydroxymethylpyrimidine kinase/phosphomethylpyrimidine kinase [Bacillota bacterium]|nr:bifunctional hydroxymethylpyrimidine kinase/phosphomethylpyrimidine kinase [Bacillota bacterium]
MKKASTIAGSDSGGGAGIQADIKTFSALGVYAASVITAVTVQNTLGVQAVTIMEPELVQRQLEAVLSDIGSDAVKIGMLGNAANIQVVAETLVAYRSRNIVLDPVLASSSGFPLLPESAVNLLKEKLFPVADIVTPNLPEAGILTGLDVKNPEDMILAASKIHQLGPRFVLIKGGHLAGKATDLFYDGVDFHLLEGERINTKNTHGTGCTLSSAIAAYLAQDLEPLTAVRKAKEYLTLALANSFEIGHGKSPVNHFYEQTKSKEKAIAP